MELKYIYKSDINRDINGVIKVAQDDEKSIEQELREYIITKELRKHFNTFLYNYENSLSTPTDKIGVWISGFFGSGKSHFLKILSYLLSNKIVAGKRAVEYFADKFDDQLMFSQLEHCASVDTDAILFNIDSKSPINKDNTAILRIFAKVFYEHCGFYGDDLKVARLEQFIAKSGATERFKETFKRINGGDWEDARDAFAFFEDDIVETLTGALGMSETAARNWFNGTETADISIDRLVNEIKEYIDSRGKDFRLLFMIDEVGQYIGSDGSLMLNLQTIVEEIGSKCGGRVWVMVTSQEAIDSITKISGDDFSKIQGRFNTRLSLSSSSVDEVIKKRILAKTEQAEQLLSSSYNKNNAVLKNLFTFNNAVMDLKGYTSEYDFIETYPFVPYQFRLMQNVLAQIRKHGNSGKHLSGGERSMLSGFQEAAQAIENKDENALVPFCLFYNTVHTFLESAIRRVIDRCQDAADKHDGIEQYDVSVLKLLYLIRYVDDIKANIDNIATLMVDDMRADKINMRKNIQASLDRLVSQNYVARNGDTYTFLTDDEQDIERDIKNTPVDSSLIKQSIARIIFDEIYINKKFRYGKYDFSYDRFVDDFSCGQLTGAVRLRILTAASDLYKGSEQTLIMKSNTDNEAILVLSDKYSYFEDLENAAKIDKYVKSRNVSLMPESIQHIIRDKQQQASAYKTTARGHISSAIIEATAYVYGEVYPIKASTVKDKIESALSCLIESVYSKLSCITRNFDSDSELLQILDGQNKQMSLGGNIAVHNPEAVSEVEKYIELQNMKMLSISMGDIQRRYSNIPYGWREIDIAAAVASLVALQKITVQYMGSAIQPSDKHLPDYLRRKNEIDKTIVTRRTAIPDALVKKSREFLRNYFGAMDVPSDEDGLIAYVIDGFTRELNELRELLNGEYSSVAYPGKAVVENGIALCESLLSQKKDNVALLTKLVELEDDLLDFEEDFESVKSFFKSQRGVYDDALRLMEQINKEHDYFAAEADALATLKTINDITRMPNPYNRIGELPELIHKVKAAYFDLLSLKKDEVEENIRRCLEDIRQLADEAPDSAKLLSDAETYFNDGRSKAASADSLTELDAMITRILAYKSSVCHKMEQLAAGSSQSGATSSGIQKISSVRRYDLCSAKRLQTKEDIDKYVDGIREKLLKMLESCDGIQIN